MPNYSELRHIVDASGYKKMYVAEVLGISMATLDKKLKGETEFKLSEAAKLATLLGLSSERRDELFFGFKEMQDGTPR